MNDHIAKTVAVYDTIADEYNKKIDDYAPRPEREKFIEMVTPHGRILDVGCGPGRDCEYFVSKIFDVNGIDLSEKLLELAKKRAPTAEFQKQDLRELNFPNESFDGIWACASLLHLKREEAPAVLSSFSTLLKSGGVLFVMLKEGKGEADVQDPLSPNISRHFTYFGIEELKEMLIKVGFFVVDIYRWNEEVRRPGRRDLVWISSFSKKNENY